MSGLFSRKTKVQINFIDLDNDNQLLESSNKLIGKVGEKINFDPQEKINSLATQGYILDKNEFNNDSTPTFGHEDHVYKITFHHEHVIVDANHPGYGFSKAQLEKKLQQTIHYQGAASRNPEDSVTEVTFSHVYIIDKVTGQIIKDKGYQPANQSFQLIGTPTLPGFVPDKTVIGGKNVTAEGKNQNYTVNFVLNHEPSISKQTAKIIYVDLSANNKVIATDLLNGSANMPIDYDPKNKIKSFEEQGFELVNNGFNAGGDTQFFGNADNYEPIFVITLKYVAQPVNSENPLKGIDPSFYERTSKFTVKFTGGGNKTPKDFVQTAHWKRTITVIPKKNKILVNGHYDTPWKANIDKYADVKIPVIHGYHTDNKIAHSLPLNEQDQTLTIAYHANGHLVPVDENGNIIDGVLHPQFETDLHDPSKVMQDEVVPSISGYKCDLMTVSPTDPGKDLNIVYKKQNQDDTLYISLGNNATKKQSEDSKAVQQSQSTSKVSKDFPNSNNSIEKTTESAKKDSNKQIAIINFIDVDHNGLSVTSSGQLTGQPGESINDLYSTEVPLKILKKNGYHVVFNNFDKDGFVQRFDNNNLMPQVFTIGISKKTNVENGLESQTNDISTINDKKNVQDLVETKKRLEKIKPTLLAEDDNDNSKTVTGLLDTVTTLLDLVSVLGSNKKDKE